MKRHLTVKGPVETKDVRRWLQRPLARLERRIGRFPSDAVHLRILVRVADDGSHAEAVVTLQLPSNTLATSEEGVDARSALHEAFTELERVLQKEKERMRRSKGWRRSSEAFRRELRERVERESSSPIAADRAEPFAADLREVERFVRRELRWLETSGEIVPGEIDARDVVDSTFARAFARRDRHPPRKQLFQTASAALRAELARTRSLREELHIEEPIPVLAPEDQISTPGSEIIDFYQADDGLHVADMLVGLTTSPEEIESTSELAELLENALSVLPGSWRQAFHLQSVEGLDEAGIASALGIENGEVPRILAHTRAFLRERLDEAGLIGPVTPHADA